MQIQKLVLDTTYILPLFGIKITDLSKLNEGIKTIWEKNFSQIHITV